MDGSKEAQVILVYQLGQGAVAPNDNENCPDDGSRFFLETGRQSKVPE